jgi:hypothetical protein
MAQYRSSKIRYIGACAAIAVGASLGVLAPPALAAPVNDNFANRIEMPSTLPSEVEGSNVGATAESPEWISEHFDAHHSVWWEWQAPETRLVAVGTCGSEIRTHIGIFTGESLGELLSHRVVPLEAVQLDGCGERYFFEAVAGTKYEFGVDGESFSLPGHEGEPAKDEGAIKLQVKPEPAPANDDIENAAPLNDFMVETPDGLRQVTGSAEGYNWGATREPGEPAGPGGGASVWYRWTPVESAPATLSVMADGRRATLDVFARGSLGALIPVASGTGEFAVTGFLAEGEREYLIRVDGLVEESGLPWMGTFFILLGQRLPPGLGPPPTEQIFSAPHKLEAPAPGAAAPPVASSPPAAPLVHAATVTGSGTATVRFGDATPGVSYRCKVDAKRFRGCASPLKLRGLAPGRHRLEVRARTSGGAASGPAVIHFRLPVADRRHHGAG